MQDRRIIGCLWPFWQDLLLLNRHIQCAQQNVWCLSPWSVKNFWVFPNSFCGDFLSFYLKALGYYACIYFKILDSQINLDLHVHNLFYVLCRYYQMHQFRNSKIWGSYFHIFFVCRNSQSNFLCCFFLALVLVLNMFSSP